jgi:DNA-binding helix-hairpin-helix protein with protein kinase domain
MRVRREESRREIVLGGAPLARGGEAAVYALPGEPALVAKVYHQPTPEHGAKLAAMMAAPPVDVRAGGEHLAVAWPVERLLAAEERGRVVGCLLPRVEDGRLIAEVSNPQARLQVYPQFHYGSLLRTARNLAAAVRLLHERGYVLGDLNESNVLVNSRGLVTLVDADSYQVPGPDRVYRCRVGKGEYTPPELQEVRFDEVDRRPEHDNFALATLVFQLLMQGLHPFAGLYHGQGEPAPIPACIAAGDWPYAADRCGPFEPLPYAPPWHILPPAVQELFHRCFEDGHSDPASRPDAAAWQQALEEAEPLLRICSANDRHRYADSLDVCPWCVLARQQDHDPFTPSTRSRRARSKVPAAALVAPVDPGPPAALDPDDPLPPRPGEQPPAVAPPTERADPGVRQVGSAGRRRSGSIWFTAAAVGGLVGVLCTLWQYRAALTVARLVEEPAPAETNPRDDAAKEAQRQAEGKLQIAREHYQQSMGAYQQLLKDHLKGRVPIQTVQKRAQTLREEARRLLELERAVAGKTGPGG